LRDWHLIPPRSVCGEPAVTTKEIPKRELREHKGVGGKNNCHLSVTTSYNKRNPKKGIESQKRREPNSCPLPPSYNKRNPKKGIESPSTVEPQAKVQSKLQQKKSQKGN